MPIDPLTALSVAGSVIQLVDFSLKIVSKSKELYRSNNGILEENAKAETVTTRLKQMTGRLKQANKSQSAENKEAYSRLGDICKECAEASDELIRRLGKLEVPTWSDKRKWKSFRQALKTVWSKQAIDEMAKRLQALRAELDTHILEILSQKLDNLSIQQHSRFEKLDKNTRKIIDSVVISSSETREYLRRGFESLRESDKAEHAKSRAAFVAKDGEKRRLRVDLALLESLRFPEMNHRHERVAEAHKETFLWAFRDPRSVEKPWDNFIEWLSKRNGIYWIQGKAASGKSTLMRFIWHNDLTQRNLELWSGHSQLVVAAFFFWNSGVPEQRSQLGLLRSLLFSVLQDHRTLVSHVFPEEWKNKSELAANDLPIGTMTWSLAQLQKAFTRLALCASQQLKMCFFIDGLDEYEGDPEEIAQYFKDLSEISAHAKFCLSSRPWPTFQTIYHDAPGLKVQDMTHDDIKLYVEDRLERNPVLQDLLDEDPGGASGLIEELVNKADGVFLWVVLVVKSLINGLRNGDGIVHLRRRLEAIPSDLETLYDHMLNSIDPLDAEEASQMIQIFRRSGYDLDLATLERALRTLDHQAVIDMEMTISAAVTDSTEAKQKATLKRMNARLNSRCKGLLEVLRNDPTPSLEQDMLSEESSKEDSRASNGQNNKRKCEEQHHLAPKPLKLRHRRKHGGGFYHSETTVLDVPNPAPTVTRNNLDKNVPPPGKISKYSEETGPETEPLKIFYLHRTVRDYLEQPKVWEGLLAKALCFDPCVALLMSYITELKQWGLSEPPSSKSFCRSKKLSRCTEISIKVEHLKIPASEPCLSLNLELDRVIGSHWWGEIVVDGGGNRFYDNVDEFNFLTTSQGKDYLIFDEVSEFPMTVPEVDFTLDN
ncbi:uncharacterized protein PAC_10196 [Phialocephala subalpina]|uniref:Uncharacterized protein n=1 Tax=Phialocephala subalpina TaxID=576137 RepID=A0A1L7X5J9_9HELO|nr:uncharacterized protein PAC_10196 [Phialocephala subalpina]